MTQKETKKQLVNMLTVRQAHMDFEDAVADFPAEHLNTRPANADYGFWHLVEHIRLGQQDILEYITSDDYKPLTFPDGYWPDKSIEADLAMWNKTIEQFYADRNKLVEIIMDANTDILAPLPNSGEREHNILREINIIANHNAYHTGELGILRETMGLWGKPSHSLG